VLAEQPLDVHHVRSGLLEMQDLERAVQRGVRARRERDELDVDVGQRGLVLGDGCRRLELGPGRVLGVVLLPPGRLPALLGKRHQPFALVRR